MSWSVYMLRCRDGSLYTGISTDLPARIRRHNDGSGAKYTRSRRPVVLVWRAAARDEGAARRREAKIKRLPKAEKERLAGRGFRVLP